MELPTAVCHNTKAIKMFGNEDDESEPKNIKINPITPPEIIANIKFMTVSFIFPIIFTKRHSVKLPKIPEIAPE